MKIALVTGANSGFGLLTCIELLKAGYRVVATMRNTKNQTELMKTASELGLTKQVTVCQLDVTNTLEINKVKAIVDDLYGELDVLINNAGYCQGGYLEDLSFDEWKAQFKTNVFGVFQVTKEFLPLLEKTEHARIITISSVSGFFEFPGMSAYCASKFAIERFSESLRLELLPKKIYVSLVEPASYQTNIWKKGLEKIKTTDTSNESFKQHMYQYAKQSATNGSDPLEVATLIHRICETPKPKFRYQIGKGAKSLFILKHLIPFSFIEKIVIHKLK